MNGFRAYLTALALAALIAACAAGPAMAADEGLPLPEGPSAADGLRDLLAATTPQRTRTGLGIPGYADLLGRGWKGKAADADAKLIAQLAAAEDAAPRRARAARAGTAPDYTGVDPLGAGDLVRGPGGKQKRSFRFQAAVDPCPVPHTSAIEEGHFEVRGDFRGQYEVTTTERVGRHDVITNVLFELRGTASAGTGLDATMSGIAAREVELSITRSQVAKNRKTGKTKRTGPPQTFRDVLSPLWVREGGFSEFIAEQDGDERPAPRRVLRSDAWSTAADAFIEMTFVQLAHGYVTTEKRSTTPGVCMELSLEGPGTLAPGETTPITGHVFQTHGSATKKQILMQGFGAKGEYVNDQGQKAVLRPDYDPGWSEGKPWYDFTAPAKAWPISNPIGFKVILTTGAGVDEATIYFKPAEDTLYYEVLNASLSTHTTATGTNILCGAQSGSIDFDGTYAPHPFSPDNKITLEDGFLSGEVGGRVSAVWHDHHLEGCRYDESGKKVPCTADMPDRTPRPDGTWGVSFSVRQGDNPGEARLTWALDDPSVGFFDAGDPECYVYMWGPVPMELQERTVSMDTLRSTEPITLNFNGTTHIDHNIPGYTTSIDYTWTKSLTIQRVDENGQPLG